MENIKSHLSDETPETKDTLIYKIARAMQVAMKDSGYKCAVILNDMYVFVPYDKALEERVSALERELQDAAKIDADAICRGFEKQLHQAER